MLALFALLVQILHELVQQKAIDRPLQPQDQDPESLPNHVAQRALLAEATSLCFGQQSTYDSNAAIVSRWGFKARASKL